MHSFFLYRTICLFVLISQVFTGHLTPQHIEEHIKRLISEKYQLYVISLGNTVNNNPLKAYIITGIKKQQNSISQLLNYPATLITSYMHPREPYSIKLMETVLDDILNNNSDYFFKYMLDHTLLILFPFVNIDGYYLYQKLLEQNAPKSLKEAYRKNLNKYGKCNKDWEFGVDINRNFDSAWGSLRTSDNQCQQEYRGPKPFSQKESKAIRTLFNKFNINLAIDIHSFGNEWIYPYASQTSNQKLQKHQLYPLYQDLFQYFKQMNRSIKGCYESLGYTADGVYIDWALDQGALSFAVEVGKAFDDDIDIGTEVLIEAEEIFHRVLRKNSISFSRFMTIQNQLVIQSTSLLNFQVQVSFENGTSMGNRKLQSRKQVLYKLDPDVQKVKLRIIDTKIQEEIILSQLRRKSNFMEQIQNRILSSFKKTNLITLIGAVIIILAGILCLVKYKREKYLINIEVTLKKQHQTHPQTQQSSKLIPSNSSTEQESQELQEKISGSDIQNEETEIELQTHRALVR